ncbi:hypothetical protein [Methylocystis heyeri]|uniref:Uncharacterized protein n=1 Tax=Methylocystis heyeri TaxID=391905 RepID=A0A6B8KKQ2_9HYPH|nr:hypothetical protein [Methylocystis heyeri]QGM47290.1 hypothetical protein H2LOC_017230 [Methylocystis heyeri]
MLPEVGTLIKTCARFMVALGIVLGCADGAGAQSSGRVARSQITGTGATSTGVPTMTVKIFNDDPAKYVFPVYTTGTRTGVGIKGDNWLQAYFQITKQQILTGSYDYKNDLGFRFFVMDGPKPLAIAPGSSIELTVPLYSVMTQNPSPAEKNSYADWWNGATIQMFYSDTPAPPLPLQEAVMLARQPGEIDGRPARRDHLLPHIAGSAEPTCSAGCGKPGQGLLLVWSAADLGKENPSQLIEFTLGARVGLCPFDDFAQCQPGDVPNALDYQNVDFDVSYVNIAYGPAAMGPLGNNQVGYVGSPQSYEQFSTAMQKFTTTPQFVGWPRYLYRYYKWILKNGIYQKTPTNKVDVVAKIPSLLEVFANLTSSTPPTLFTPVADPSKWPAPESLWPPIRALFENWIYWAGSVPTASIPNPPPGHCTASADPLNSTQFCDGLLNAKALLLANYANYVSIFSTKCNGDPNVHPVDLSDNLMIAHLYGWGPFTENGCDASVNKLENTPTYSDNNYAKYAAVKMQFDKLNYGTLDNGKYEFNPYARFVHGPDYANIQNAYSYSVDDAVGNIQAEGTGFIIDVGSTSHLENQTLASSPIQVTFGYSSSDAVRFMRYSVCNDSNWKDVKPYFTSFIINANNPQNCPVYFEDNKVPAQRYTFTVMSDPTTTFPLLPTGNPWTPQTTAPIYCKGNLENPNDPTNPYRASSRSWCCDLTASAGNFAYSMPEPNSAHKSVSYFAIAKPAQPTTAIDPPQDQTCSQGAKWP